MRTTCTHDLDTALTLANYLSTVVVEDLRWSCPLTVTQSAVGVYEPSPGLAVRGPLMTLSVILPPLLSLGLTLSQLRRMGREAMRQLAHDLHLDAAQRAALLSIRSDEAPFETTGQHSILHTSRTGHTALQQEVGADSVAVVCKKCHPTTFPDSPIIGRAAVTTSPMRAPPVKSLQLQSDAASVSVICPTHFSVSSAFLWTSPSITSFLQEFAGEKSTFDWPLLSKLLTETEATGPQRTKAAAWWQAVTGAVVSRRSTVAVSLSVGQLCQVLDKGAADAVHCAFRKYTRSSPWYAMRAECTDTQARVFFTGKRVIKNQ